MARRKTAFILWSVTLTISCIYKWAFALDLGLIDVKALKVKPNAYTILDARPKALYLKGHIPGAYSFSWEDYTYKDSLGVRYRVLPPKEMARRLEARCMTNDTPIAIYGDMKNSWGGEGWAAWVLAWLGHKGPIRLLKGGIRAWKDLGYPITSGDERITQGCNRTYHVRIRPSLKITASELMTHPKAYNLIDVRSFFEWLQGHIPGATRISWEDFYRKDTLTPITRDELKKILLAHGVDLTRPVVYYCTGGVRSGFAWFVHELSGMENAINFEGGIEEWNLLGSK